MRAAAASPCGHLYIWQCQGGKYNGPQHCGLSLCAMSLCESRREVYVRHSYAGWPVADHPRRLSVQFILLQADITCIGLLEKDYRVLQTAEFNIVLPGAIVYSFATNPHDISLLLISVFAFLFAFIPVVFIFLATRKRNVTDRAFLMLNGAGFNLGCFSFPVVQSFWGAGAVVPAAMFDIGNCVMVAAGTNVLTQQLLHIQPGKTLAEQHAGSAPTLPYEKPKDRDAKRLARRALLRTIGKSFFGSVPFDTYLLMIVLTVANVKIPDWIASITQPLSGANALVSMLMVGMLMDLPQSKHDVKEVMAVIAWRIPFSVSFALIAWFLLPFSASIRAVMVICALAPIAIFSTLFTDKVLGNAKLAGFSLAITAMISLGMMAVAHALMGV